MSIASVVTRGFGSFAGRKFVPTLGYASNLHPASTAQSGVQRLINQATTGLSLSQPNAWIENPIAMRKEQAYEEETLMQIMFEYYNKHF